MENIKRFCLFFLNYKQIVLEVLTCVLAFSIPFPKAFSAYTLGVWFGMCILLSIGSWCGNVRTALRNKGSWPLLSFVLLFLLGVLSLTYADDSASVMKRLFNGRFPLFCIPVGLLISNLRVPVVRVMKSFVWGASAFAVYSVIASAVLIQQNALLEAFSSENWANLTLLFYDILNRAYTNANVVLALLVLVYLYFKHHIKRCFYWFYAFLAFLLLAFLVINTSRMVVLAMLLVALVAIFVYSFRNIKLFVSGLVAFGAVSCVLMCTENRFSDSIRRLWSGDASVLSSSENPRATIWKAAVEIDPHTYLYGYGDGNVTGPLISHYAEIGFSEGVVKRYMCHNQYLELYLELGVPGLLVFLSALVLLFVGGQCYDKRFAALVALFFSLVMITECYVSRTAGALTFAFAFCFFCVDRDAKRSYAVPKLVDDKRKMACLSSLALSLLSFVLFAGICKHKSAEEASLAKAKPFLWKGHDYKDNKVYKMDNRSEASTADGNAFSYCLFFISRNKEKVVRFDVDCFVSEDYNGDMAFVTDLDVNKKILVSSFFDLNKKGQWQTLSIDLPVGNNYVYLQSCKQGVQNLSTLTGYVLFSNPRWNAVH